MSAPRSSADAVLALAAAVASLEAAAEAIPPVHLAPLVPKLAAVRRAAAVLLDGLESDTQAGVPA